MINIIFFLFLFLVIYTWLVITTHGPKENDIRKIISEIYFYLKIISDKIFKLFILLIKDTLNVKSDSFTMQISQKDQILNHTKINDVIDEAEYYLIVESLYVKFFDLYN